ncbi:MAG: MBL fold metallo-hydrolase [Bacteroidales bacterium]|nr:MBL fold metallo-hydrolase [Bacteroidales bacterium]
MYNIINTGSKGNAVIYFDKILLDCGVPFSSLNPYLYDIQLVLLTHIHNDHFSLQTLKRLVFERPSLRIGCGQHMVEYMEGFKNVDIYEPGKIYDYGSFKVSPVILWHDVPNFGYRLYQDDKKILHATDTVHMEGISAKNYDLYCLEANYDEETVYEIIREKEARGEYAHQKGAINSHLSFQQANDFFFKNKGENSILVRLHESSSSL